MWKRLLAIAVIGTAVYGLTGIGAEKLDVNTYSSFASWGAAPYIEEAFEQNRQVDVEFVATGDARMMLAKLIAEQEAGGPGADVFIGVEAGDLSTALEGWSPFEPKDRSDLLDRFMKNLKVFEDAIAGASDDVMNGTWTMKMGDEVLKSCLRHTALRSSLIHHIAHHRGQLTVFLRLTDTPVPPTYGPTADFTEMFV